MPRIHASMLLPAACIAMAALSSVCADEPTTQPASTQPAAAAQPAAAPTADTQPTETPTTTSAPVTPGKKGGGFESGDKAGKNNGDGGKADPFSSMPDSGEMLWKMMASLMVLGVLAIAAWVLLRKVLPRIGRSAGRNVQLLETTYLGPRKAVHLLRVGRKRLLVSSSREGVCLLADVTDAVEDEPRYPQQEQGGDAS